jgi:hypothetical protein
MKLTNFTHPFPREEEDERIKNNNSPFFSRTLGQAPRAEKKSD